MMGLDLLLPSLPPLDFVDFGINKENNIENEEYEQKEQKDNGERYLPMNLVMQRLHYVMETMSNMRNTYQRSLEEVKKQHIEQQNAAKDEAQNAFRQIKARASARFQENRELIENLMKQIQTYKQQALHRDAREIRLDHVVKENATLKQQYETLQEDYEARVAALEQLKSDHVPTNQLVEMQRQMDAVQSERDDARTRLLEAETALALANAEVQTERDIRTGESEKLGVLQQELNDTQKKIHEQEQRLDELSRERNELSMKLNEQDGISRQHLEREIAEKDAEVAELLRQLNMLQARERELSTAVEEHKQMLALRPSEAIVHTIADPALQQRIRHLEVTLNSAMLENFKLQNQLMALRDNSDDSDEDLYDTKNDNVVASSLNTVQTELKEKLHELDILLPRISTLDTELRQQVPIYKHKLSAFEELEAKRIDVEERLKIRNYLKNSDGSIRDLDSADIEQLHIILKHDKQLTEERTALANRVIELKLEKEALTDLKNQMMQLKEQIAQLRDSGDMVDTQHLENQYNEIKLSAQKKANKLKANYENHERNLADFKKHESISSDLLAQFNFNSDVESGRNRKLKPNERENLQLLLDIISSKGVDRDWLKNASDNINETSTQLKQLKTQKTSLEQQIKMLQAKLHDEAQITPNHVSKRSLSRPMKSKAKRRQFIPIEPTVFQPNPVLLLPDKQLQERYNQLQELLESKVAAEIMLKSKLNNLELQRSHDTAEYERDRSNLHSQLQIMLTGDSDDRLKRAFSEFDSERQQFGNDRNAWKAHEASLMEQIAELNAKLIAKEMQANTMRQNCAELQAKLNATVRVSEALTSLPGSDDSSNYDMKSEFDAFVKRITELDAEIAAVHTQIDTVNSEITFAQSKLAELAGSSDNDGTPEQKSEYLRLERETSLQVDVTHRFKRRLTELREEQDVLQNQIDDIQAMLDSGRPKSARPQSSSEKKLEIARIHATANAKLNHLERVHDEQIQSLQSELNNLEKDISLHHERQLDAHSQLEASQTHANRIKNDIAEANIILNRYREITGSVREDQSKRQSRLKNFEIAIIERDKDLVSLSAEIDRLSSNVSAIERNIKEEQKRRKEFQIKYEDAKGKVRVYCRVRPFSTQEKANKESTLLRTGRNEWTLELNETERDVLGNVRDKWREYIFDHVFQFGLNGTKSNASQTDIFEECKDFADLSASGINTCIFAYGQSGTGKTYTMAGIRPSVENNFSTDLVGLKPRMIERVYSIAEEMQHTHTFKISCYLVEIYLNQLEDVLWKHETALANVGRPKKEWPHAPELKVRVDSNRRVTIENVVVKEFSTAKEMREFIDDAENLRRTRRTGLNEASSRSHLVFAMNIQQLEKSSGKLFRGKMSLVDLAGSERADKTNVDGLSKHQRDAMLEEGIAINESLRMLKNVFRILGTANQPLKKGQKPEIVQYRGNMLTELMQDSLGGNAKTLMFVNVGPAASNISETQDSLQYGDLVKNITNEKASREEDHTEEIRMLRTQLADYEELFGSL